MLKWSDAENSLLSAEDQLDAEDIVKIVAAIVRRRMELNLTQSELAEKSGLKQSAVARFESMRAVPRIDTLCRLARSLKLEIKLVPASAN